MLFIDLKGQFPDECRCERDGGLVLGFCPLLTLSGPGGGGNIAPRLLTGSPAKTRRASHLNLSDFS